MKTGLFFGSFNPVHIGHLAIANYFVEFSDIDQLWFVVSPHNPLKKKTSLLDDDIRLHLVELAVKGDSRFKVTDVEFKMPQPSYSIDTLHLLSKDFPQDEFIIIMGSDGLLSFDKWKDYREIIAKYQRYIYPRPSEQPIDYNQHQNISIFDAPQMDISSTFVRKSMAKGYNIRYFLPEMVYQEIVKNGYYKD